MKDPVSVDYGIEVEREDLQRACEGIHKGHLAMGLEMSNKGIFQQTSQLLLIRQLAKQFAHEFSEAGGEPEDAQELLVFSIRDELSLQPKTIGGNPEQASLLERAIQGSIQQALNSKPVVEPEQKIAPVVSVPLPKGLVS
jgi:hypothetical protein